MHPITDEIEKAVATLKSQMSLVAEEAKFVVDDYWAVFKVENKKINTAIARGEDAKKPASLAPVVDDLYRAGRKPNIRWRIFSSEMRKLSKHLTSANGKNTSPSEPLKPTVRGYTDKQLSNYCVGWETEMVLKTEEKLSDARKAIDHIQGAIVGLERILRHSKSHKQSQQELSNG